MTEAFELRGKVEAVLISQDQHSPVATSVRKIQVIRGYGIKGDSHAGVRFVDSREHELLEFGVKKGIEIANFREFSAVSAEELDELSKSLKLPSMHHGLLGENLVLSGIPRLTRLPIGTKLFFKGGSSKRSVVLVVWGENLPCQAPGDVLARLFDQPVLSSIFVKHALGRRGIVGSIYCSGFIHADDEVIVKVPVQKTYDL